MRAPNFNLYTASLVVAVAVAGMVVSASAQVTSRNSMGFGTAFHGVPTSVTSFNFGGQRGFHGVPTSVTSLGFGSSGFRLNQPFRANRPFGFRHRRNSGFANPFFGDMVAVPYAYPVYVMDPGIDDSMEQDYLGGPTIFDRRGSGDGYRKPQAREEEDYRHSSDVEPARRSTTEQPLIAEPVKAQPPTVLVYKDGHQSQVVNYAIVGETLYDLSDGRTKRVALAELDLSATEKQNDVRGVDFRIPATMKSN
jgi:hypothetical protein